jgi:hypothetical protein
MFKFLKSARLVSGLCIALVAPAIPARAVVINFDNLGPQVAVTNQYPEATFSSDPGGAAVYTIPLAIPGWYKTSSPNFICSGTDSTVPDCVHDIFVNFTNPVNQLKFYSTGANDAGPAQANVDVWTTKGYAGSAPVPGDGVLFDAQLVDLSGFTNVTKIEIDKIVDPYGLGFDDFSFIVSTVTTNGVPEPSTWAMMLLGFAALGFAGYRRPKAAGVTVAP